MSAVWGVSIHGDSLNEWGSWGAELEHQYWLTGWARSASKIIVAISIQFVIVARIIGVPPLLNSFHMCGRKPL